MLGVVNIVPEFSHSLSPQREIGFKANFETVTGSPYSCQKNGQHYLKDDRVKLPN